MLQALYHLEEKPETKVYRLAAFSALKESLIKAVSDPTLTIRDAASKVREQRRHQGDKRIALRAIGSTLLLKGLECDHVIILNADEMNSQNLYVALSRAAKSITVFSRRNVVGN